MSDCPLPERCKIGGRSIFGWDPSHFEEKEIREGHAVVLVGAGKGSHLEEESVYFISPEDESIPDDGTGCCVPQKIYRVTYSVFKQLLIDSYGCKKIEHDPIRYAIRKRYLSSYGFLFYCAKETDVQMAEQ